jgi:tetratricopeptide (TPR) repeat protein
MKLLKISIATLFTCATFCIQAQDNKVLSNAFKQSYDYEATKNYDAAINTINSMYSETSYEINIRLGWLNYLSGKFKESIMYYQKAIELMPAAIEPKWGIIYPYTKLENWTEVEKNYANILILDPKNATANYNLGLIFYYRKEYVLAKKHFDVSLNLFPFNTNNLVMSAWTNYFLGNKNEATVLFNKALLCSPNNKSALEGLSLIK